MATDYHSLTTALLASAPGRLQTRRHVRGLLADLGATSGQVAAQLDALGARGVKSHPSQCPLARLLLAVVGSDPDVERVRVWNGYLLVTKTRGWRWVPVRLPAAVSEFVCEFDAGRHPQLVQGAGLPKAARQNAAGGAARARPPVAEPQGLTGNKEGRSR